MSAMSLDRELAMAVQLVQDAGALLLRQRADGLEVGYKAHGEVVTRADLASDRLIRAGLARAFGGDALFTEESADGPARLSARRVWIVDPLDSTSTYAAGGDEFSVSIGLAIDGQPVLGAVFNPARDQLVAGACGQGVTFNGCPARVSDAHDLSTARLTISRKEWDRGVSNLAGELRVTPIASMAYKLARVAAGLDDGVFSIKTRKEWGTCAGVALVLAGGGRATLLDGSPIAFNRKPLANGAGLVAASAALQPVVRCRLIRHTDQSRD
jgi:myo-inositol-1(or 4)-monophosphatase